MEWTELQVMWQQYDARLTENTRINKEILKRIIRRKPERRVNWVRFQSGVGLLWIPIFLLLFFAVLIPASHIEFNHGLALYLGIFLYGGGVLLGYYWSINYFMLLRNIDFSHSVITTRKNLMQLEKYQTKTLRRGSYLLMPFAFIGIILIFNLQLFTKENTLGSSLILVMMVALMYYKFRWKNWWFKKLNAELDEIEQLEKE